MSRFGWAFVNDIVTGSGGNPGGSDKQVQFNSGSTFSGSSNLTYDYNTNILSGTTAKFTLITGSSLVVSASVVSASTYLGIPATTTPGGTNRAIQFNSGSTFSGSTNLTYDYTNGILSGTIALFSTITGSNISGNIAQFNTLSSSNAIVTNTTTVGNYVQLLPITDPNVPTNTTASYIYTSGSTNDMYFTQYGGGYSNTTRLRWLEGALSTGLLYGGLITTVTGTNTFSVSSGSGIIVSYNANSNSEPYPTIKYVNWGNFVSQSLIYSGSGQVTYVSIDDTGAILQNNTTPNATQYKDRIILGRVLHLSGAVTTGFTSSPSTGYAATSNNQDFFRSFGPLKVSGHVLAASGSTISITKTSGDSYAEGRNYTSNANVPNYILAADDYNITTTKIYYEYVSGSTIIIDSGVGNAGYSALIPNKYVNNGILTTISPTNNKFTIQRVYWFPKSSTRALYVYYGNTIYNTIDEALLAVAVEPLFIEGDNTKAAAIYVGAIVLEADTSDLTITTKARIVQGGLFRGSGVGSGGGGSSTTPPGGVTHTVQYNDTGAFNGSTSFTYDTTTLALTGAFNVSGNVSINGGILSGTTAQFTTVTGSTVTGSTALFTTITGSAYSGGSFIGTSGRFTTFRATGATTFDAAMAVSGGITAVNSSIRVLTGSTAMATMDNFGVISGSGNMLVGGNLTVAGASTVTHVVSQGSLSAKYQSFTGSFVVPLASWFCGINSSAGAVTASLNLANTYFAGQPITFKDIGGFAGTAGKGILIQASGSDKIDGASSLVISATSGSVTVVTDGSSNFFITSIV